jgi:spore photoproduct lyase
MEKGRKNLLFGEFIRGEDGKYRYIKAERIKVYTMLYNQLKSRQHDLFVYFCMERSDIWKAVTGIALDDNEGLIKLFDKRIHDIYGGIV